MLNKNEKIIQIFLFCETRYTVLSDVATDYINYTYGISPFFFNGTNFKLSKYKVAISDNVHASSEVFIPTKKEKLLITENAWFIKLRPNSHRIRDENLGRGKITFHKYIFE